MNEIVIKVSDLLDMANSLSKDGMKHVKLSLFEEYDDIPAHINFEAIDSLNPFDGSVDYEDIDAVDIDF